MSKMKNKRKKNTADPPLCPVTMVTMMMMLNGFVLYSFSRYIRLCSSFIFEPFAVPSSSLSSPPPEQHQTRERQNSLTSYNVCTGGAYVVFAQLYIYIYSFACTRFNAEIAQLNAIAHENARRNKKTQCVCVSVAVGRQCRWTYWKRFRCQFFIRITLDLASPVLPQTSGQCSFIFILSLEQQKNNEHNIIEDREDITVAFD